jgi:FHA domain-containing protein
VLALLAPTLKNAAAAEESPGIPLWMILTIVAVAVVALGAVFLLLAVRKGKATEERCANCGKVMMSDWPRCMFCKTPRGMKKAALEFVSGPMAGRTLDLDGPVTTIGSAPGSTVTLADPGVSRKHAGIRKTAGEYELADLGSTNGVYVNGEKVAKRRLQLGDVIRIGTTEMVFKG